MRKVLRFILGWTITICYVIALPFIVLVFWSWDEEMSYSECWKEALSFLPALKTKKSNDEGW
jgi:hypothetical protein